MWHLCNSKCQYVPWRHADDGTPFKCDGAQTWFDETANGPQYRRFSCPIGSDDAGNATFLNQEINTLEYIAPIIAGKHIV